MLPWPPRIRACREEEEEEEEKTRTSTKGSLIRSISSGASPLLRAARPDAVRREDSTRALPIAAGTHGGTSMW